MSELRGKSNKICIKNNENWSFGGKLNLGKEGSVLIFSTKNLREQGHCWHTLQSGCLLYIFRHTTLKHSNKTGGVMVLIAVALLERHNYTDIL